MGPNFKVTFIRFRTCRSENSARDLEKCIHRHKKISTQTHTFNSSFTKKKEKIFPFYFLSPLLANTLLLGFNFFFYFYFIPFVANVFIK